ncbi:glycosyl hydrolase 108 family protein [uncultured Thiocystis sp.]|jgi:lysozyme family protein|uniref:glycoside hydrolase family 108 protein n=1 Tax=uncultured Thiocystis sp. TaxID=1202134 RepID=UPI0025EB13B0|nr:glycosyl hydrolase 108 family protein [uncultured Thiocystis sp.]
MSRFHRCIDFVLLEEGGLVNHPKDPGKLTKFGISQRSYPRLDIRRLTVADAKAIYQRDFWDRIRGDALPVGLDLVVLDMAVNAGAVRAVQLLQQLCGVDDDGLIGSLTLAAIQDRPSADLIESYSRLRLTYYRSLKHWPTFGEGWEARVQRSRQMALALALDHAHPLANRA